MSDTDQHFGKIFWYVAGTSLFVLCYVIAITFLPIPKENQRFVDISLGFLLGTVLAGGTGYLIGGNPSQVKKPSTTPGQTTAEITANISSSNDAQKTTD